MRKGERMSCGVASADTSRSAFACLNASLFETSSASPFLSAVTSVCAPNIQIGTPSRMLGHASATGPDRVAILPAIASDLVIRVRRIRKMLRHIGLRHREVLEVDHVLPLSGTVRAERGSVTERLPEPRADPPVPRVFEVPVPDPVQRSGLEELEDPAIRLNETIEFFWELKPTVDVVGTHLLCAH